MRGQENRLGKRYVVYYLSFGRIDTSFEFKEVSRSVFISLFDESVSKKEFLGWEFLRCKQARRKMWNVEAFSNVPQVRSARPIGLAVAVSPHIFTSAGASRKMMN